ncbi:MAG: hypothetical protein GX851_08530 [Clostridiales bacterium]|nr:hypothetical protein [Clostridiales bacterium]
MNIADNIIKNKLKNVYFIWGSGKTVTANALAAKYGFFVYHTDNRTPHFKKAEPEYQPAMCRNVPDVWALDKNNMLGWEAAIVREMTPMIIWVKSVIRDETTTPDDVAAMIAKCWGII